MAKTFGEPGGTAAKVERIIRPAVENLGFRLWDVRFEKEGVQWFLRVLIDRDTPMDTDACEAASRAIDPLLDEADPIEQSYCLEVGSPGLGRKLTREAHFKAMAGRAVLAKLYAPDSAGDKELRGELAGLENGELLLDAGGRRRRLPLASLALVKLCDDEGLFKT